MATTDTKKGVPGIPLGALDAITDENTRQVLRNLVDGWHVRNGSSGSGDSAFITKGELGGLKTTGWFGGNNQTPDSSKTQIKPSDINRIINDLQAQVMESLLFKELGERVDLIDKPGGIFDRLGATELVLKDETIQRVDGDTALSTRITTMGTRVGQSETAIQTETFQRVNADNALQTTITTQYAAVNQNLALIQTANITNANNVAALSQSVTQVQTSVGSNAVAIQQEYQARVNANNDLYAKISFKIDMNGYVSGFGLMSTANNSTPFSEFIVRADRFAIGSPSGPGIAPRVPFIVTTGYDGNGNPPGVYMDMLVVRNASIKRAMIGDAEVDTLKIAGNAVTLPFSSSFGQVGYDQQVASSWQYLETGSKIIVIVTYTVMHMGFHGANMTIGAAESNGGRAPINGNGFSFENYGNGVISGAYITPHSGWWCVTATPGGEGGGICTGLTITAQGAQR